MRFPAKPQNHKELKSIYKEENKEYIYSILFLRSLWFLWFWLKVNTGLHFKTATPLWFCVVFCGFLNFFILSSAYFGNPDVAVFSFIRAIKKTI